MVQLGDLREDGAVAKYVSIVTHVRVWLTLLVHLLCDLPHTFLQVIVLFRQSSVLLKERLADSCGQFQISLFLLVGKQEEKETTTKAPCLQFC